MMCSPLNPSQDAAFFGGRLGRPDLPFLVFSFSIIMVLTEDALERINPSTQPLEPLAFQSREACGWFSFTCSHPAFGVPAQAACASALRTSAAVQPSPRPGKERLDQAVSERRSARTPQERGEQNAGRCGVQPVPKGNAPSEDLLPRSPLLETGRAYFRAYFREEGCCTLGCDLSCFRVLSMPPAGSQPELNQALPLARAKFVLRGAGAWVL